MKKLISLLFVLSSSFLSSYAAITGDGLNTNQFVWNSTNGTTRIKDGVLLTNAANVNATNFNNTSKTNWSYMTPKGMSLTNNGFAQYSGLDIVFPLQSVGVGQEVFKNVTIGYDNTAFGFNSQLSLTTGYHNDSQGRDTLYANTNGVENLALGHSSLRANQGDANIGLGFLTLLSNVTGSYNLAGGVHSQEYNLAGVGNTSIGFGSLSKSTNASYSTAVGYLAAGYNCAGLTNTAVGAFTLQNNTNGYGNTVLGAYSGFNYTNAEHDNVLIGHRGVAGENNTMHIGTIGIHSNTVIAGLTGIGGVPIQPLTVYGDMRGVVGDLRLDANQSIIMNGSRYVVTESGNDLYYGTGAANLYFRLGGGAILSVTTSAVAVSTNLTVGGGIRVSNPTVPASAGASGTAGDIAWDSGFIYVCVSANTWKRVAIATW